MSFSISFAQLRNEPSAKPIVINQLVRSHQCYDQLDTFANDPVESSSIRHHKFNNQWHWHNWLLASSVERGSQELLREGFKKRRKINTRSSIAFKDTLRSSIAPQIVLHWHSHKIFSEGNIEDGEDFPFLIIIREVLVFTFNLEISHRHGGNKLYKYNPTWCSLRFTRSIASAMDQIFGSC